MNASKSARLLSVTSAIATASALGIGGPFVVCSTLPTASASVPQEDLRLIPVVKLGRDVTNAGTVSDNGRIFLGLQGPADVAGVQVAEWKDGGYAPYPGIAWNSWHIGADASKAFVHVNSMRIGPDGDLWVVDTGGKGLNKPILPGGPKLVQIDIKTNTVKRVYVFSAPVVKIKSFVDDVRFHGDKAYLTDAGEPALIVLDLKTGNARRILDSAPSTTAQHVASGEGKTMYGGDGKPIMMHADQMEVTEDGGLYYFQPQAGPMYSIPTKYLDDPKVTNAELQSHVQKFVPTQSTGGTAIDAAGNIYIGDTDKLQIQKIAPDGKKTVLITDPYHLWADAMWIDNHGYLWIPAAQQNRTPAFQNGVQRVHFPVVVYKMYIGAKPNRH